jgi:hypothetical protein
LKAAAEAKAATEAKARAEANAKAAAEKAAAEMARELAEAKLTGINFVDTNWLVRDALQRFMVESSCSLPCCAATRQTRVVSVKRVENEPLWQTYQSMKKILKKNCAAHKQGILSLSAETKCQPTW